MLQERVLFLARGRDCSSVYPRLSGSLKKKERCFLFFFVEYVPLLESDVHITMDGSRQHQPVYMQHLQYIQTGCFSRGGGAGCAFGREINPRYSQYMTIKGIF